VRPTIHLTNWSSRRLHHGRVFTIMARPRPWEHGAGVVDALVPPVGMLDELRAGNITTADYMVVFAGLLRDGNAEAPGLLPGVLFALQGERVIPIRDGDTLCCACSVAAAKRWECHRAPAAVALLEAGWSPVVDGFELCIECAGTGCPSCSDHGGRMLRGQLDLVR